jgi:hypothetical protein
MNFSLEGRVLSAQWQEPLADDHSDRNPHATNTGLAAHDTGTEGNPIEIAHDPLPDGKA